MKFVRPVFCMIALLLPASPSAAKVVEKTTTYSISGQSGAELYESIGQNGPKAGVGRVIAHTTFDLKWSRNYVPKHGGCTLVSARPSLIIIYTLPKPKGNLPAATRKSWDVFIDGVTRHEKVHGDMIRDMVKKIEGFSVGFSVADDPKCKKIREELTKLLAQASLEQRQLSRDFDQVELGGGGNIHRLILDLVNGP